MQNMRTRIKKYQCYILYTALFFFITAYLWNTFRSNGKWLIWLPDGAYQHYNAFRYVSEYAASIGKALLKGESLSIPMMNYTLGQGADVVTSLSSYDFLNPLCWFMAILFYRNSVLGYELMTLANLYLAGVSFVCFCQTVGQKNSIYISSGALAYVFCGFAADCRDKRTPVPYSADSLRHN